MILRIRFYDQYGRKIEGRILHGSDQLSVPVNTDHLEVEVLELHPEEVPR